MRRRELAPIGASGDHGGVLAWLAGCFEDAQPTPCFEILTPAPGAYLLLLALSRPLALPQPALKSARLRAGHYLYAGSALGPGGIRARILRHARKGKRRHWHIDHLTAAGTLLAALALPGMGECDVLGSLLALPGVTVPVPGFGSSDCRTCPAHLIAAPDPWKAPEFSS
ncbi:MAG: GIY-YIG nuclease family protein [Proteobacteria bacterium]|nr:GIY-YIG nuclease family protein [Pseudomonadota bacterium]